MKRNIAELIGRSPCLINHSWEVVFVDDDSPDALRPGAEPERRIAGSVAFRENRPPRHPPLHRGHARERRPYLGVIYADMQHYERLLPQMLETLKQAISTRGGQPYAPGRDIGDWDARRARMSRLAVDSADVGPAS